MKNNQCNFFELNDLPNDVFLKDHLSIPKEIKWAKTSQFNNPAKNHCGAALVTNLALYYSKSGYDRLNENKIEDSFSTIHNHVGNGPKLLLSQKANLYFKQRGYDLKYTSFRSHDGIKKSISENKPLALLVCAEVFEWHWVMVVGWVQDESKDFYVKIVTGWDSKTLKYYKLGRGSCWLFATSYTIDNRKI